MKLWVGIISITNFVSNHLHAQTIWTENFNNSCASNCAANTYTGINGAWSINSTGTNAVHANQWYISGAECGMNSGECGTVCGTTNSSLHIGVNFLGIIVDVGASYLAGASPFGSSATDKRTDSPTINRSCYNNIVLTFNYLEGGQATTDNATLWIFDGSTWSQLVDMPKTFCCDGSGNPVACDGSNQGLWEAFTISLPLSTFDNPLFRIGFRWANNNDNIGTDPSFAVDDITISGQTIGGGIEPNTELICNATEITNSGATSLNTYSFLSDMTCNNQVGNNSAADVDEFGSACSGELSQAV